MIDHRLRQVRYPTISSALLRLLCNDHPMQLGPILQFLAGQGYPCPGAELVRDGTCPVLLADDLVIKLFAAEHRLDHDTELAAYQALNAADHIPIPRLLTRGRFDGWDYLGFSRAPGIAALHNPLTDDERQRLAHHLGHAISQVHAVPIIEPAGRLGRDWLQDHGRSAADRHRAWQTIPAHLIEQIDDYLVDPSGRALVHADLAVDHVFTDHGELTCIIDWGGAEATDPHYELPILHFDLFGADKQQLSFFLEAYDWPADDFVRRAMSATLCLESDSFALLLAVRPDFTLDDYATLESLADDLWRL